MKLHLLCGSRPESSWRWGERRFPGHKFLMSELNHENLKLSIPPSNQTIWTGPMEYQKEKFRTLSCFVNPPWLSEVKRVVGIKKLCWSGWKLLGYEHWAVDQLDRLDQVDRLGKVFGRLTWDHNVNSGSRDWLSVSSQSFYWQGVAESQRAQIIWIIWAIWHWFDSHSYSALSLGPASYSFCIQSLHPVSDDFNFWLSEISILSLSFMEGEKTRFKKSFSTSQQLRTVLRANYHYVP